jgi:hypothetical protein
MIISNRHPADELCVFFLQRDGLGSVQNSTGI